MTKRLILLISAVSLAVAGADNFSVNLIQPTTVNGTTFKPGDARIELKDSKVIIKQGKVTAEAPVKVENNKTKYIYTGVGYKEGADHQIREISIGGTTTHIVFEDGTHLAKNE
jgi:hypothetical protein